jgi:hypothetical protein
MLRRLVLAAALCLLLPALIGCEKRIREASVESTPAALNPV